MDVLAKRTANMIELLKKTYRPGVLRFAEIGVYDGVNAQRIVKALAADRYKVHYVGFDFFEDAVGVDLSKDNPGINAALRKHKSHVNTMAMTKIRGMLEPFCASVILVKGNTGVTLNESFIELHEVDVFYIDGGHSFEVVSADWEAVRKVAKLGALVIFDDVKTDGVGRVLAQIEATGVKLVSLDEWRKYLVVKKP